MGWYAMFSFCMTSELNARFQQSQPAHAKRRQVHQLLHLYSHDHRNCMLTPPPYLPATHQRCQWWGVRSHRPGCGPGHCPGRQPVLRQRAGRPGLGLRLRLCQRRRWRQRQCRCLRPGRGPGRHFRRRADPHLCSPCERIGQRQCQRQCSGMRRMGSAGGRAWGAWGDPTSFEACLRNAYEGEQHRRRRSRSDAVRPYSPRTPYL